MVLEVRLLSASVVLAAVSRVDALGKILEAACNLTGMRFAAVARVTSQQWLTCAVRDEIAFGLQPGDELDVKSTLCHEVGQCGRTIVIDHVAEDPRYRDHHAPAKYGFQSYISAPINRNGRFFGTLCALDPEPARPSDPAIVATFELFAELIARQLDQNESLARTTALIELSDRARDLSDPNEMSSLASEILGRTIGADRCGYALVDADLETATIYKGWAAAGIAELSGVHHLRRYGSFIDDLNRGEAVVVNDAEQDARTAASISAIDGITARALVNLPIIEAGRLVALLYVHCAESREWSQAELDFIKEVANRTRTEVERRRAEQDLRTLAETLEAEVRDRTEEVRRFKDIVEATASPICAFDHQFRLIAFNSAHNDEFRRVNGFDTKVGDVFPDLFIPKQAAAMRALMARALTGERFTVAEEFGRPEFGTPVWEIAYAPLLDDKGTVVGAFHHATDISARLVAQAELEKAQDALRQSQKMEAMGQLTGGVAHDFNNLLTPIIGSLDMLVRKELGTERDRLLIGGALQSAERARTLVQRLLAFARRQPLQPTGVSVGRLVAEMQHLLRSTLGPAIELELDIAPDLPLAKADQNQLEMAVLNLAVNARDAMPLGGTFKFVARREKVSEPHAAGLKLGHYLHLRVSDTGVGMNAETLSRAIEPFFSTKGVGKGTGLGLSMVHGLVAQLGGGLTIESELGCGTTIAMWLPMSLEAPGIDSSPERGLQADQHAGIALLVDDEELVRVSTAAMLSDLGFDVIEAGSATQALELLASGTKPTLLVTDHLMPGMNGAELVSAIKRNRPDLPMLIVSGYAEVEGIDPSVARLTKPFRRDELAAQLAALIEKPGPPVSSIH